MSRIHPSIMSHKLALFKETRLVAQKKRRIGDRIIRAMDEGVKKVSRKWRMCTNYTDLNKGYPKDAYPLPSIDGLVDEAFGHKLFSFLDAYSSYNQIPMYASDWEKTTFITEKANYYYEVVPFGLKNIDATYQSLMDKIFVDQIGKCMDVYDDDMVVWSNSSTKHYRDLKEVFG